jgi:hypothetical protein
MLKEFQFRVILKYQQIKNMTFDKDKEIQELRQLLITEKMIRKSEVLMNEDLRNYNERLELHKETLIKINDQYSKIIAELRIKLKDLINKQ